MRTLAYLTVSLLLIFLIINDLELSLVDAKKVGTKGKVKLSKKGTKTKKVPTEPAVKAPLSAEIEEDEIETSQSIQPKPTTGWFSRILRQSLYEQEVEDVNALHRMQENLVRRLIVMPLSESFKMNQADAMHQKVQYGDKCSLPSSLGRFIFDNRIDVPWIFEIKPIVLNPSNKDEESVKFGPKRSFDFKKSLNVNRGKEEENINKNAINADYFETGKLSKAYISPLDFRSPENYIFLPKWLMNDLNLLPNDLVEISLVRIKLADLVVFQPITTSWDELIKIFPDPKTLLEHEVNKYSSLTSGSTIYIKVEDKEYPIFVKETRAEGGVAVHGVRVQDSDVKVDIDRSLVDKLLNAEKEKSAGNS